MLKGGAVMPLVNDSYPRVRPDTGSYEDSGVGERSPWAWVWILGSLGLLFVISVIALLIIG
jgi:hypothetical protein